MSKAKAVTRMMRRDRSIIDEELLDEKFDYFLYTHLDLRDIQDIFIRSLLLHGRKPDSGIYKEALKGQRARIAISDLTKKELASVKQFLEMVIQ